MSAAGAFGARLKQEREARGVSLDELSRATKVRKVFLEALEAERWDEMPSRVFVVGYIRAIAEHLHADAAALQHALEESWPAPEEPAPAPSQEPAGKTGSFRGAWVGVALLAAVLGVVGWRYLRPVAPPSPPPAPPGAAALAEREVTLQEGTVESGATASGGGPVAPVPLPPEAVPSASAPATGEPSPVAPALAPLPPARETPAPAAVPPAVVPAKPEGDLWIEVSGPCWMELFSGERRLVFREVQAGERLSFDGRRFSLTLGDAAACRVFWKGAPVTLPTQAGKVVRGLALGEAEP